ncbi:MAG: guanylate kinase [Verrucomicrobia bacterium]|nr:guanylate kinase [Verrucomicrobiota bacterium]
MHAPKNNSAQLLIVSGPAGSGKTTVCEGLLRTEAQLERVITTTTRPPRGAEVNGGDYHFLEAEEFEARIAAGDFYEYARVHGKHYGTQKKAVQDKLEAGINLLLNVDVQGAASFRAAAGEDPLLAGRVTTVFIMPPGLEALKERLEGRGTDSVDEVQRRIEVAKSEMQEAKHYDHLLHSSTREADLVALQAIYRSL